MKKWSFFGKLPRPGATNLLYSFFNACFSRSSNVVQIVFQTNACTKCVCVWVCECESICAVCCEKYGATGALQKAAGKKMRMLSFRPSYFFLSPTQDFGCRNLYFFFFFQHLWWFFTMEGWNKGSVFFFLIPFHFWTSFDFVICFYVFMIWRYWYTVFFNIASTYTKWYGQTEETKKKKTLKLKMSLLFCSRFALRWSWCEWDFSFLSKR